MYDERKNRMKKRVMSLLLVMLMVFALLPAAAMATNTPAPKDENNVYLAKSYDPESGKITLEAYTKGEVTVTTTEKAVPCDIVLVLDVSGSMVDPLGSKVTVTADQIYQTRNQDGMSGYSYYDSYDEDYYPIYITKSGNSYSAYYTDEYNDDISVFRNQAANYSVSNNVYLSRLYALKTAVNVFIDKVQENAAENEVTHRVSLVKFAGDKTDVVGNNTYSEDGYTYNNSQIVTNLTDVETAADATALKATVSTIIAGGATAADYGMQYAKKAFDNVASEQGNADRAKAVVMFTDGEPNHHSGFDSDVANAAVAASKTLKGSSYNAQVYTVGVFNNPGNDVKKYMNAVSSNYPNASKYNDKGIGTDITGYFMNASSASDLNNIFKKIADQTISGGSLTELDAQSYVLDKMSEYFQLDGVSAADTSKVEIFTEDYTAENTFTNRQPKTGLTVSVVDGDTVKVTGYDFSDNWVGYDESTNSYRGQKLIIKFPVQPKAGYTGTVPTNDTTSGIYDKDDKVALTFPMPDYTPNYVPKIIDFNAKMILANGVGKLGDQTGKNGQFELTGGELTYQFKPLEKLGDRVASLIMNGVDSAMTFTSNVWTQYDAIPANNIYFDDALLETTVNVTDGAGYNAGVTSAASQAVTDVADGSVLLYTFRGTGIDVYCTTNADGGYVQAGLMTGDTATAANLVYFESAEGHYFKDGDNYVRIDKEHPAPDGAKLYDSSLLAVRNYSVTPEGKDRYNVPTVSYTGLPYGTYTVRIKAVDNANYKLDGIRVYNAMANDESVYAGTNEANASFFNLRENLLNDGESVVFTDDPTKDYLADNEVTILGENPGVLFIDDVDSVELKIEETGEAVYSNAYEAYVANGPKNEIYLSANQGVAFKLADGLKADHYWLGLSAPDAGSAPATVLVNGKAVEPVISSAVDMYYPITPDADGNVVVVNQGGGMVALTNLKVTRDNPVENDGAQPFGLLSVKSLKMAANSSASGQDDGGDPGVQELIRQLISSFVRALFDNITRLFGK